MQSTFEHKTRKIFRFFSKIEYNDGYVWEVYHTRNRGRSP